MPSPAETSKTERLKLLARPLEPTRFPFYVQHATAETPMMGWWWEPRQRPLQPLGASYEMAFVHISNLVNASSNGAHAA